MSTKKTVLNATISSLLALGALSVAGQAAAQEAELEKCYGVVGWCMALQCSVRQGTAGNVLSLVLGLGRVWFGPVWCGEARLGGVRQGGIIISDVVR